MERNTGCGCDNCPPMPACDVAQSKSSGCNTMTDVPVPAYERTVVLEDLDITIPVEADIKLPSFAQDIKAIRKNVHLTQCKVVQVPGSSTQVNIFVEGYVHKNIQYAEDCNGYLKDYSINVPFKCYKRITLTNPANVAFASSKNSSNFELRELAANGMEADRCNFGSVTFENNNEPIHCKLLFSQVNQWDITNNFDNRGRFDQLTEKMEVFLFVRLTQIQPVFPVPGAEEQKMAKFQKMTGHS